MSAHELIRFSLQLSRGAHCLKSASARALSEAGYW